MVTWRLPISNELLIVGNCYATEVIDYSPGTQLNGSDIAPERSDPNQALGEPERSDVGGDFVFASLGYSDDGGSITLGFGGSVPNLDGDDLEFVETTWGNPNCGNEFADVYVSMNGADFAYAKTVCRGDGFVDISDAGDYEYIMYVKVVQGEASSTSDGYDLDGVVALHNCDEDGSGEENTMNSVVETSMLTSYPNPTNGPSVALFSTGITERATLEVYDVNGRLVQELFNGVAEAGVQYRADFDGSNLSEGVYLYRLTTAKEVTIEKFILTR